MNKRVIILMGAPGSGKGTQAGRLSQKLSIPHISTGDLFRKNIKEKTALGSEAQQFMDKGLYVPDELVLQMLFDRVSLFDCNKGYILDGFPRTVDQAIALDVILEDSKVDEIILNLNVDEQKIVDRLAGRISCKECGHIYQKQTKPPKKEGTCDLCGGELVHRPDDDPRVVKDRFRVYNDKTGPVLEYYRGKGKVVDINGDQAPDDVLDQLLEKLSH